MPVPYTSTRKSYLPPENRSPPSYQGPLTPSESEVNLKADDRRKKMEELLSRLNDKYQKREQEMKRQKNKAVREK